MQTTQAQDSMFDMPEPVAQDTPVVAHTLHDYNAAWYPAWYEQKAAQAEAAGMAQAAAYYRMRADECRKAWGPA